MENKGKQTTFTLYRYIVRFDKTDDSGTVTPQFNFKYFIGTSDECLKFEEEFKTYCKLSFGQFVLIRESILKLDDSVFADPYVVADEMKNEKEIID